MKLWDVSSLPNKALKAGDTALPCLYAMVETSSDDDILRRGYLKKAQGILIRCIITGRGSCQFVLMRGRIAGPVRTQSLVQAAVCPRVSHHRMYKSHVDGGSDPSQRMSESQATSAYRL